LKKDFTVLGQSMRKVAGARDVRGKTFCVAFFDSDT